MWKTSNGRLDRLIVFSERNGATVPIGGLTFEGAGRIRSSTFRYAQSWLDASGGEIDPTHLPLKRGMFRSDPSTKTEVPLPFLYAAPDGWGRSILTAAFPEQHFGDGEFLAATGNERTGELRFGPSPDMLPERWTPGGQQVMTIPSEGDTLETLQAAVEAVEARTATAHHLAQLVRAGSDIGGARPKATIWRDGFPLIAKFRSQGDAFDEPRVEATCLTLARACGIEVPAHEVVSIGSRSVLLVSRFDRPGNGERLGYSSAATMMGVTNTGYATGETYASLATKARQHGVVPCEAELFRRLLFNCFIHNTDDHLRNHGFLRQGRQWRLSPAFDVTVNRSQRLVLAPAEHILPTPDPLVAFAAYPAFGMARKDALDIYEGIVDGLATVREALDAHDVPSKDRATLTNWWHRVYSPPAVSELPESRLMRPSRSPGGDPVERLAELGVEFSPDTHNVRKVGRGIALYRKDSGQLDNVPGMPARVRDAWTTSPRMEFFRNGMLVSSGHPAENG